MFGPIDWRQVIDMIIILLISIDVHELAHAVVADRLGDPTPRRMGEMSLNPFVHMDQIGVVLLLLTSLTGFGFTYGRTHVTPTNLRFGPQRGNAVVAIVGPLSNLALAALCTIPLTLQYNGLISLSDNVWIFLLYAIALNLLLFVLNLIPIPPLDGFTVLGGFLSARQMYSLAPLQQWGPVIILVVFLTNPQTHIVGNLIDPAVNNIFNLLCSHGCGPRL
jgi:Zn-dependent protease